MNIYIKGKDQKTCIHIEGSVGKDYINQEKNMTDNQCEWISLLSGIRYYSGMENRSSECNIYMDSLLLFQQVTFKKKTKADSLIEFYKDWNRLKNTINFRSDDEINYNYIEKPLNKARRKLYDE